ncbi:hypothetical protein RhiirA5_473865 [Rhizophagus irregularis]|nr:hypothetical protein GLOIN_2v1780447 [Rhizophagus irregularis DAOM 181602=DAOM 197198]EXX77281.1 hypothetical protein RirG_025210 [Rhizophagus irregularis DAOM 197198w]PKC09548.1 hypothetical protein RhiirA5_473863 [Rhizophagus irregularis]PKC09550.1 hypothetical protein RhiirA5_473865 [Rhizophagus irregularis]PKY15391.1 hypothetical protein RhiirB3_513130 [Rhizophagus irregularis]POG66514.1 hypothetical protein GLOIN_2v1780447 [Rhizophagus irregularis DAOM 181602=DAOM 197198]|eukprot:XP_025173380.1 hypothetical protein GLOIN_2v1780447 [Rhizophagus irregularis DAOM 181602=DAOM 197198]
MDINFSDQTLPEIVADLLSHDEAVYKKVLDTFFTEDATLSHPLLNVYGSHNIRKVFRVWATFNKHEPEIQNKEDIVFDGITAVINIKQHICPRVFPFLHFVVPTITTLRFREERDGYYYIYRMEDSWTLEGLFQSVPLISWCYETIVRKLVFGKLITGTGYLIDSASSYMKNN